MLAGFPLSVVPFATGSGGGLALWPDVNAVTGALEAHDSDQGSEVVLSGDAITIDDAVGKAEFRVSGPFLSLQVNE